MKQVPSLEPFNDAQMTLRSVLWISAGIGVKTMVPPSNPRQMLRSTVRSVLKHL